MPKTLSREELLKLHPKADLVDFKQVEEVARKLKESGMVRGYKLATPATQKRVAASKRQTTVRNATSPSRQH
jgi:hypothetical protein